MLFIYALKLTSLFWNFSSSVDKMSGEVFQARRFFVGRKIYIHRDALTDCPVGNRVSDRTARSWSFTSVKCLKYVYGNLHVFYTPLRHGVEV
jgi:hypothetical protein